MCRFGVKVADLDKEMFYIIYDPLTKLDDFGFGSLKLSYMDKREVRLERT